jgi:hypothetical protein
MLKAQLRCKGYFGYIADIAVMGKHEHGKPNDYITPGCGVYDGKFVVGGLFEQCVDIGPYQ